MASLKYNIANKVKEVCFKILSVIAQVAIYADTDEFVLSKSYFMKAYVNNHTL